MSHTLYPCSNRLISILILSMENIMQKNVNSIDKSIRIVLSLIFFSTYFILEGNLKFIALVGFIPLLTGLVSFCPLYRILGVSTCKLK